MASLFVNHRHRRLQLVSIFFSRRLTSSSVIAPLFFSSSSSSVTASACNGVSSGADEEGAETQSPQSLAPALSQEELASINLLIPRLCFINQLPTAIRLTSAALLLPHPHPPPLRSLSLPVLIHCLSCQPDFSLSASLLTRLHRCPPLLIPVASLLTAFYVRNRRPRDALQVFDGWLMTQGSPCPCPCLPHTHPASFGLLLATFCRNGMVFEALKVLSAMLAANVIPGSNLRRSLHRSLLREARIVEAVELDRALDKARSDRTDNSVGKTEAELLLDRVFRDWTE